MDYGVFFYVKEFPWCFTPWLLVMWDITIQLQNFSLDWKPTIIKEIILNWKKIPEFINEFWTSKQRQWNSLHEISYRACFKSELPRFFISQLSNEWDIVYDPFSWRWTTAIESWLLWRNVIVNDINPLTNILTRSRFFIPSDESVASRLDDITKDNIISDIDLSMFYHDDTLKEILNIKKRVLWDNTDYIDERIRMVATSRLTWHSKWFFSVYTLPPNQAVSQERQKIINKKLNQIPEYRDTKKIILKKSKNLKKDISDDIISMLKIIWENWLFLNKNAWDTPEIKDNSVSLIVTSPPFMDVIDYAQDNWLRCWFNWIDVQDISKKITISKTIDDWCEFMEKVFIEFYRILKKWWKIAFEVWEIKNWSINLDEYIVMIWMNTWFKCDWIVINDQDFTKTANIRWVSNNNKGTNTNRIVLFSK